MHPSRSQLGGNRARGGERRGWQAMGGIFALVLVLASELNVGDAAWINRRILAYCRPMSSPGVAHRISDSTQLRTVPISPWDPEV